MLSLMAGASLGGMFISKLKFRTFYLISMVMSVVSSILLYNVNQDTDYYKVILIMIVLGLGAIGPLMSVSQNAVANSISKDMLGTVNSLVAFFRNIGGILGASIMATIVNNSLKTDLEKNLSQAHIPQDKISEMANPDVLLHASTNIPEQVLTIMREALSKAINHGFIFALVVCSLGIIVSLFVGNKKFEFQQPKEESAK